MKRLESLLRIPLLLAFLAALGLPTVSPAASAPEAEAIPPTSSPDEVATSDRSEASPGEIADSHPEVTIVSRTKVVRMPRIGPRSSPVGISGIRAILNPNTGSLVSMPRESREGLLPVSERLRRGLSTSHEGLHEIRLPDGTVAVDLQGRFLSALTATVTDRGEIAVGHGRIDPDPENGESRIGHAPIEGVPTEGRAPDGEAGPEERKGEDR